MLRALFLLASLTLLLSQEPQAQERPKKALPLPGTVFTLEKRTAFVIEPAERRDGPMPWVWYAPTLPRLPGKEEAWMFERFLAAGIAIAGIDVGESYGNPAGRALYQKFYEELTGERGWSRRPVLLARSRGGLMLYGWATDHPTAVGGIAGIYPVCNPASYPGMTKAAKAYGMPVDQFEEWLPRYSPLDRLAGLAAAKVPIFHIHGDKDRVVPLRDNTAELAKRYRRLKGRIEVEVVEGQGHNMWPGWFRSEKLTEFVIDRATAPVEQEPDESDPKPKKKGASGDGTSK